MHSVAVRCSFSNSQMTLAFVNLASFETMGRVAAGTPKKEQRWSFALPDPYPEVVKDKPGTNGSNYFLHGGIGFRD